MEKQLITGNEPIQPVYTRSGNACDESDVPYLEGRKVLTGLTKREHFAALALQGLLANLNYKLVYNPKEVIESCASDAVIAADALIEELNK